MTIEMAQMGTSSPMAKSHTMEMGKSTTHRVSKLHKVADKDVGYHYIELPPDTLFVESAAHNDLWEPGVAYVPVLRCMPGQNGQCRRETHLYEIRPGKEAKHLGGPIELTTTKTRDVTIYGSHLTSTGILWMTFWNNNLLSFIDLKELPEDRGVLKTGPLEIPVPAPNDLCVDPEDENILYIAGGSAKKVCCGIKFVSAAYGKVYKAAVCRDGRGGEDRTSYRLTCIADGLDVLAGIEVHGRTILVAQLFDVLAIDKRTFQQKVIWTQTTAAGVWLADNVAMFDDKLVVAPAFDTVDPLIRDLVLTRPCVNNIFVCGLQIYSALVEGENIKRGLWDPEVSLAVCHTYAKPDEDPQPIRLALFDREGDVVHNFEIDLQETREFYKLREKKDLETPPPHKHMGNLWYFDENVTHCTRMVVKEGPGWLMCVNFQQPRIMMLQDSFFTNAVASQPRAYEPAPPLFVGQSH